MIAKPPNRLLRMRSTAQWRNVVSGLRQLGYNAWLACGDTIVALQRVQFVNLAAPVQAASARYGELRQHATSLTECG